MKYLVQEKWTKAAEIVTNHPEAVKQQVPWTANIGKGEYPLHAIGKVNIPQGLYAAILNQSPEEAVNHVGGLAGVAPLHTAVSEDNVHFVKGLLAKNANVNLLNEGGKTALDLAKTFKHHKVHHELLTAGAQYSRPSPSSSCMYRDRPQWGNNWGWTSHWSASA